MMQSPKSLTGSSDSARVIQAWQRHQLPQSSRLPVCTACCVDGSFEMRGFLYPSAFLYSPSLDPLYFPRPGCPGCRHIPAAVPGSLRSSSLACLPSSCPLLLWRMFKGRFSIGSSCLLFALLEVGSLEELGRGRKRKQGCLSALLSLVFRLQLHYFVRQGFPEQQAARHTHIYILAPKFFPNKKETCPSVWQLESAPLCFLYSYGEGGFGPLGSDT